jgi:signal transduction histidine kinase
MILGVLLYVRHIRVVHSTISYREIYEEIYRKNEMLNQLKNDRDRIIRHIGHDLRQPVNALSYALFNITHNALSKMQEEQVQMAKSSIKLVNHMIDDILQVAIYQDIKSLPIHSESFQLTKIFKEIEQEYTSFARNADCELKIVDCSVSLISDSKLVARIIKNFISNAIRYGSGSKVLLGARRRQDGVDIQVLDQGPGIKASLLNNIFEEFSQADTNNRGLGLGLNSAKNIAETIGGKVSISSIENHGTVCTLRLPLISNS